MDYLYIKNDKIVSKGKFPISTEGYINIEVNGDIYNNFEKYIYSNGEIILDPDYEEKLQKKLNKIRIDEIKDELNSIDFKTIRSLRASEVEKINEYENKVKLLRAEMDELIDKL